MHRRDRRSRQARVRRILTSPVGFSCPTRSRTSRDQTVALCAVRFAVPGTSVETASGRKSLIPCMFFAQQSPPAYNHHRGLRSRSLAMTFSRITADSIQMGGVPCIRGLRIPVATVVDMVADGMPTDEILRAYPDLDEADIREALRFAAEAVRERELPLLPVR